MRALLTGSVLFCCGALIVGAPLVSLARLPAKPSAAAVQGNGDVSGLKDILADGATVDKVAGGFRFTEGPLYDREKNIVLFSDQPTSTLQRYDVKTGKADLFRDNKVIPNGNIFDRQGQLISCEHRTRRVSRTDKDGRIVTLAYEYEGKRLNSPNDIVLKSDGAFYFTDPPYGIRKEQEELGYNAVFRLNRDGSLIKLVDDFARPNGLAFSPDEKTLYVDDTERGHIRAFDVQPDGTLANGRVFAELRDPGKRGAPDGMKVDSKGNIFCTGPGGVWVFAPDGRRLGVIETPEVAANCGFGDRDGKTLYITASTSLYRVRLKNAGPISGKK